MKDRNGKDQREAEKIKKRWQEYIKELRKKGLNVQHKHDGVVTHLQLDILKWEVKWALRSIIMNKASGGDGIPAELFKILKDNAVKMLHSIHQQIWKTQQWPQDWKSSVFIPISTEGNVQTTGKLYSFHMLARSCSKSSMLGFNSTWTKNFQMFKLDLETV